MALTVKGPEGSAMPPDKIIIQFQWATKTGELFVLCSDGTLWQRFGNQWKKIQGPTDGS